MNRTGPARVFKSKSELALISDISDEEVDERERRDGAGEMEDDEFRAEEEAIARLRSERIRKVMLLSLNEKTATVDFCYNRSKGNRSKGNRLFLVAKCNSISVVNNGLLVKALLFDVSLQDLKEIVFDRTNLTLIETQSNFC